MAEKTEAPSRRDVLKLGALAAPAAAATVTAGTAGAEEIAAEAGQGLRKTPHVEAYLKSARF